jgi:purine-binding chemotaxis protein CheW
MKQSDITEKAQYLSFRLSEEFFALNVTQVREVLDMCPITRVPRSPEFMRGVINVRGSVIPVVDLRRKFGIPQADTSVNTRIIVIELTLEGEKTVIGAVADAVHEVVELDPANIEASPTIGSRWRTDFIKGIGKQNEQFIIILDIDRIFSSDELAVLDSQTDEKMMEEAELM